MKTTMELSGDVRAAILRVLEEYSPGEGEGAAAAGSSPGVSDGPAVMHPSPAGVCKVRQGDYDEATGLQDRPFPV
jgi:hypothetical protein